MKVTYKKLENMSNEIIKYGIKFINNQTLEVADKLKLEKIEKCPYFIVEEPEYADFDEMQKPKRKYNKRKKEVDLEVELESENDELPVIKEAEINEDI